MSRQRRILVVDDDQTLRETLAEVLREDGFDVRDARNGQEALDELDGWQADLIVLDLMMPIMDADAFNAAQIEAGRKTPILVVSAAPHLVEAAERLGAVGMVAKPFRIRELREQVTRGLGIQLGEPSDPSERSEPG
jgi:DNA-binding response OmpR family regulator